MIKNSNQAEGRGRDLGDVTVWVLSLINLKFNQFLGYLSDHLSGVLTAHYFRLRRSTSDVTLEQPTSYLQAMLTFDTAASGTCQH